MARIMREVTAGLAPNVFTPIFTPPAGKKFELLTVGLASTTTVACEFVLARQLAGTYTFLDQLSIVVGRFAVMGSYSAILIPTGHTFEIAALTAAVTGLSLGLTYMDVDTQ